MGRHREPTWVPIRLAIPKLYQSIWVDFRELGHLDTSVQFLFRFPLSCFAPVPFGCPLFIRQLRFSSSAFSIAVYLLRLLLPILGERGEEE